VRLNGRALAVVGAAGRRPATRLRVLLRPARYRWQVVATDATGARRASSVVRFRVAPAGRAHALRVARKAR
jgi:hypothetical protein